jgi:hypothetical protein
VARIRTIKPEFPQSETIGSLSRDARLLFIQLWTIVDDEGRARAASRMLASLLYPYDDDAVGLIGAWLDELELASCIRRYEVDGSRYLEITQWRKHQKIDKPSVSKLPAFDADSPPPRDNSRKVATDLGSRTKDQDQEVSPPSEAHPPQASDADEIREAVAAFNAAAERVGWAKVQRLTDQRRVALRARLADVGGLDGWRAAVEKAAANGFLCGENERGWKLDFDFLIKPKNLTKIMEGGYDRSARTPTGNVKQSPHAAFLGAIAREAEKRSGGGERDSRPDDGRRDFAVLPPPTPGFADDLEIPTILRRQ